MTPGKPLVSCLVVTYNSATTIESCLFSLASSALSNSIEVLVRDNASSDDTLKLLERENVHLVVAGHANVGFAAAVNELLSQANGRYVLLLNPDCVLPPEALTLMLSTLEQNSSAVAVGPLITNQVGTQLAGAGYEPTVGRLLSEVFFLPRFPLLHGTGIFVRRSIARKSGAIPVGWLAGTALLVRRTTLVQLGGLDQSYFLYFEDMDLGRRIGRIGYKSLLLTEVAARHVGGASHATSYGAVKIQEDSFKRYLARTTDPLTAVRRGILTSLVKIYFIERRIIMNMKNVLPAKRARSL